MFRSAIAAALAASLFAAPAAATTSPAAELAATIRSVGVPVFTDAAVCRDGKFQGVYDSARNMMLICADEAQPHAFTKEQRDTLRHEAIHMAQDCHGKGGLQSGALGRLMTDEMLQTAIGLSGVNVNRIVHAYRRIGADDDAIRLELEAWALAPIASEAQVIEAIERLCKR